MLMTIIQLSIRKSISIQLIIIITHYNKQYRRRNNNNNNSILVYIIVQLCNNSNCHRGVIQNVMEENVPRFEHVIIPADNINNNDDNNNNNNKSVIQATVSFVFISLSL
jgi:hypothetical protein